MNLTPDPICLYSIIFLYEPGPGIIFFSEIIFCYLWAVVIIALIDFDFVFEKVLYKFGDGVFLIWSANILLLSLPIEKAG